MEPVIRTKGPPHGTVKAILGIVITGGSGCILPNTPVISSIKGAPDSGLSNSKLNVYVWSKMLSVTTKPGTSLTGVVAGSKHNTILKKPFGLAAFVGITLNIPKA